MNRSPSSRFALRNAFNCLPCDSNCRASGLLTPTLLAMCFSKQEPQSADVSAGWSLLARAMAGESPLDDSGQDFFQKKSVRKTEQATPASSSDIATALAARDLPSTPANQPASQTTAIDPRQDAWTSDKPMPRLKRPEELRELIRICEIPLQSLSGWSEAPWHPEEVAVQQVRNRVKISMKRERVDTNFQSTAGRCG